MPRFNFVSSPALQLLKRGPFARYMAGETVSMIGTWMQQMAQGWVVTQLTSSAFTLGLVNFAAGIPMLALTMLGGTVADRFDKRRVLLATQVVQIILAIVVGWLVGTNRVAIWHILVAGILLGISTAFEMPAASALVPELVGRERLSAAIAIDRSLFHATRLGGPALGGWLIGTYGTAAAFYANAFTFIALIAAILTLDPRAQGSIEEEAKRQTGMKEGIAYVRSDRPTLIMLALLGTTTLCISPFFMIIMPLYSRHVLHVGAQQHGFLMAASGIGAFAGSAWLLSIPSLHRARYLRGGVLAIALAMAGLSIAHNVWQAIGAMIVLTLGSSTIFGLANTIVQERAPDYIRGRVSAIVGLSFFGVLPFSGLIVSKFADLVGVRLAMGVAASCYGCGGLLLLFLNRRLSIQAPITGDEAEVV